MRRLINSRSEKGSSHATGYAAPSGLSRRPQGGDIAGRWARAEPATLEELYRHSGWMIYYPADGPGR